MEAYSSRKQIKDLYDIYFLSTKELSALVMKKLSNFVKKIEKPVDEKTLKTLIYAGAIPSFDQIYLSLKRRCLK